MSKSTDPDAPPWKQRATKFSKINKPLIPLKVVLFCFYASVQCLMPFLTLHLKALQVGAEYAALVNCLLPIFAFFGPSIAGFAADKIGNLRMVLALFLVSAAATHLCLLAVPGVDCEEEAIEGWEAVKVLVDGEGITRYDIGGEVDCRFEEGKMDIGLQCEPLEGMDRFRLSPNSPELASNDSELLPYNFIMSGRVPDFYIDVGINSSTSPIPIANCYPTTNSTNFQCFNGTTVCRGSLLKTLLIYMPIRAWATTANAANFALIDATTYEMPKDFNGDMGWNKAFGQASMVIWGPFAGWLGDLVSAKDHPLSYWPCFALFAFFTCLSMILVVVMKLSVKPARKKLFKDVWSVVKMPGTLPFFLALIFIGMCWGFLRSFLFWFLRDLGASKQFCGWTQSVSCFFGLIGVTFSTPIINRIGRVPIIVTAIFAYGVRMFGISLLTESTFGYVLFLEALEVLTFHLFWIAVIQHSASFSPDLIASIQGIASSLHFGLGKGLGALCGVAYKSSGRVVVNRGFAAGAIFVGVVFAGYHIWDYFRSRTRRARLASKKQDEGEQTQTELLDDGEKERVEIEKEGE